MLTVPTDIRSTKVKGERRPLVEDDLQWNMTFGGSLHAAYSALLYFFHIA